MPKSQQDYLGVHGYYGSVKHNARAVYQFYLGWFDAHPSNLDQLPPVEEAKRYVALAGGVDNMIATAQKAFDARAISAGQRKCSSTPSTPNRIMPRRRNSWRTFDQMGYMAESAPWRNFYLTGATELRNGAKTGKSLAMMQDMLLQTPIERFLERMAASIDGAKAADSNLKINISFSDLNENYVLWIENAVLHSAREHLKECERDAHPDQAVLHQDDDRSGGR